MKKYETMVPEAVRNENAKKLAEMEREIKENNQEIANLSKLA